MIEKIDFDKLIEKVTKEKCEITISCEPTRTEITIQPWKPYEMKMDIRPPFAGVRDFPAAEVVPVVRCKDCEFWDFGDCYRLELSRPDDFCSYGERKAK